MIKLSIFIAVAFQIAQEVQPTCNFAISDVPKNEPVYLEKNSDGTFQFFQPVNNVTILPFDKEIILLCPVSGNSFVNESVSTKTLRCKEGKTFTDTSLQTDVELSDLSCAKNVAGELQISSDTCASGAGKVYFLGFNINGTFVKQIEICFNASRASTYYSRHVINGLAIKYNTKESDRRSFLSSAISVKPYELYTKSKQIEVFKSLFNIVPVSDMYYLSRGHLSPDADFIFSSGQFATYFYLNVVPEYQIINQGNWLRVERLARNVAFVAKTNLDVITGGQEILSYNNTATNLEYPFYLAPLERFIEVPKLIYKILINEREKTAIVLITSNDPYLKSKPTDFCTNICSEVGLVYPGTLQDLDKGYTICCSLASFKTVARNLPTLSEYATMSLSGVTY